MNMGDVSYLLTTPQESQPNIEFEFEDSHTNQSEQESDQHLLEDLEDNSAVYYEDSQTSSQDEAEAIWNQSEEHDHGVFEERLSDYEDEHEIPEERLSDYETTEYGEHELSENEHSEAEQQCTYDSVKFPKNPMPIHTEEKKIGKEILPGLKPKPNIISNVSIKKINRPPTTVDVRQVSAQSLSNLHNKTADTSFNAAKFIVRNANADGNKKSARVLNFSLSPDAKFELPIIKKAPIIITNRSISKLNQRQEPNLKKISDANKSTYTLEFPKASIYVKPGPPSVNNSKSFSQANNKKEPIPLTKSPVQVLSNQNKSSPNKTIALSENHQPLQGSSRAMTEQCVQKAISEQKQPKLEVLNQSPKSYRVVTSSVALSENGQPLQGTKRVISDQSVQKINSEPKQPKLEMLNQSPKSYRVVTSSETNILPKLTPKPVSRHSEPEHSPQNHKYQIETKSETNYDSDESFELLFGFDENSQTLKAMVGSKNKNIIENNNKIKTQSTSVLQNNKSLNNSSQKLNDSDVPISETSAIKKVTGKNIFPNNSSPESSDRLVNQITKSGGRTVITKVLPRFLSLQKTNKKKRRPEKERNKIDREQEREEDKSYQDKEKNVNRKSNRTSEEMNVAFAMQKLKDCKAKVDKTEKSPPKKNKHTKAEQLPDVVEEDPKAREQFSSALAKLFMECNIPLGVVEDKNFKNFVQLLKPEFVEKLPSSKELLQNILQL